MCLVEGSPTTFDAVFYEVHKMASLHYVHVWAHEWRGSKAPSGLLGQRNVGLLLLTLQW